MRSPDKLTGKIIKGRASAKHSLQKIRNLLLAVLISQISYLIKYGKFTRACINSIQNSSHKFLEGYCISLNRKAKEGKLDPVIGRAEEIERGRLWLPAPIGESRLSSRLVGTDQSMLALARRSVACAQMSILSRS